MPPAPRLPGPRIVVILAVVGRLVMAEDADDEVLQLPLHLAPASVHVLRSSDDRGRGRPDRDTVPGENAGILLRRQRRPGRQLVMPPADLWILEDAPPGAIGPRLPPPRHRNQQPRHGLEGTN